MLNLLADDAQKCANRDLRQEGSIWASFKKENEPFFIEKSTLSCTPQSSEAVKELPCDSGSAWALWSLSRRSLRPQWKLNPVRAVGTSHN